MTSHEPTITILDGRDVPHPEDNAMIQALYSRSPASVTDHLTKVASAGSGGFMSKFYVGYNHKSIGDCGTPTVFVEGVTMLCAKALQDWPLYNGQEASTRFMDFSDSVFHNPLGTPEGERIQERWRTFYLDAQGPVREHVRTQHPLLPDDDAVNYGRAIAARSFDILRALLPAGASTNLSLHMNLRQLHDLLRWAHVNPDPFIAEQAQRMLFELRMKYPHSFNFEDDTEEWRRTISVKNHVLHPGDIDPDAWNDGTIGMSCTFYESSIARCDLRMLRLRPRGEEVPRFLQELGLIRSEFMLDFGSYRDLQRHRNGTVRMPLLTTDVGFHRWYLDQLPGDLRESAEDLLREQTEAIRSLDASAFVAQNYIAMGYKVPCRVTQSLPAFVYRLELRSGKTVHPTLREVILSEIKGFRNLFPSIPLYVDEDPDSWTVRRGRQTITEKTDG
jgi:thymidylate synthase ThyX